MNTVPTIQISGSNSHDAFSPRSPESADPEHEKPESEAEHTFERIELVRIAGVAIAAIAVWFRVWEPFAHISVIGVAAALIGGYPIFKEAFENIVERKMTMIYE